MDMHFPTPSIAVPPPLTIIQRGRARHDTRALACFGDEERIVTAELTEARDILAECMDKLVLAGLHSNWPGRGINVEDILADVGDLLSQVARQVADVSDHFPECREPDNAADDIRDQRIGDAMVFGRSDW